MAAVLLMLACAAGLACLLWLRARLLNDAEGTLVATWIDPTLVVTLADKDGAPNFLKRNVRIALAPGEYQFRAAKDDQGVFHRVVKIEAGKTERLTVAERGTLAFETTDPTLKVKVDRISWPSIQDKGKHVFSQTLPVGWHVCQVLDGAGKVVWEDKKVVVGDITEIIDIEKMPRRAAEGKDDGWVQLFNGKDLTGWKTHPTQPGNWQVDQDGVLVGTGPQTVSHLFSERGDFENFHLRTEARINFRGKQGVYFGNSGIYFRSRFAIDLGTPPNPAYPTGY
jgi:hypothetical protein